MRTAFWLVSLSTARFTKKYFFFNRSKRTGSWNIWIIPLVLKFSFEVVFVKIKYKKDLGYQYECNDQVAWQCFLSHRAEYAQ